MSDSHVPCCGAVFWLYIATIVGLVLFAGLMSGLTLGLMSLSRMELEVLIKSGVEKDRRHAEKILPVVKNQHLLLCTLIVYNAIAMETLPIFLDSLISAWGAIIISVTLILLFGEILPQAVCSRYGLAIGATIAPVVRVLVWISFPITYPISKLLDFLLGKDHVALFRRAELKTLVSMHSNEARFGGELTHDETTIISGALEMTEKTAVDAMTPLSDVFSLELDEALNQDLFNRIITKGHSRIPVYVKQPENIIGVILVKNMLTIQPSEESYVKNVTIRKIPRVSENMPLYDILNEFQKGLSHMAVVVKRHDEMENFTHHHHHFHAKRHNSLRNMHLQKKPEGDSEDPNPDSRVSRSQSVHARRLKRHSEDIIRIEDGFPPAYPNDELVLGIITMEDVMEELLQEEIFDETDRHKQVLKRLDEASENKETTKLIEASSDDSHVHTSSVDAHVHIGLEVDKM